MVEYAAVNCGSIDTCVPQTEICCHYIIYFMLLFVHNIKNGHVYLLVQYAILA